MHGLRFLFSLLFLLAAFCAGAQDRERTNMRDKEGRPHGFWYIRHPEHMGDPPYSEFGNYDHGRKYGVWNTLNSEGTLLSAQRYKNNALDGESSYYDNGRLVLTGNYRGLNPDNRYDTIWVVDPITGHEKRRIIPTENGSTRHGTWRYYDAETGRVTHEEEYQVDSLISYHLVGLAKADSAAYLKREAKMPHHKTPVPKSNAARLIKR